MTGKTIAHRRWVYGALHVRCFQVGMAGQADRRRRRGNQLDARDVLIDANLMTAKAAHRYRRMNRFSFGAIFVALETFRGIDIFVQRDRVNGRSCAEDTQREQTQRKNGEAGWAGSKPAKKGS